MRLFLLILLGFLTKDLIAQIDYKTESDSFLYWQPEVKIKYLDYKGDTTSAGMDLCRKYKIHNLGEVHIQYVLDIPIKERKRGKFLEKAYIAPVFCKHCSFSIKQDSIEMLQDQVYFDIAEYCSRIARIQLDTFRVILPGYGAYVLNFATITNDMDNMMHEMFGSYTYQLYNEDSAYIKWRLLLDKGLARTQKYATKPEECYRLLINSPIDKDYMRAEYITPPRKRKK